MNQEKLKQLQAQVRIGGKGTARRKKKVVHRTATTDDKKLQSSLKKLSVSRIKIKNISFLAFVSCHLLVSGSVSEEQSFIFKMAYSKSHCSTCLILIRDWCQSKTSRHP